MDDVTTNTPSEYAASSPNQDRLRSLFKIMEDPAANEHVLHEAWTTNPDLAKEQLWETGQSALMLAAHHGHVGLVKNLLSLGAPWNALDRQGKCAGNYAVEAGHQECIDVLVEAGVQAELILGMSYRLNYEQQLKSRGQSHNTCREKPNKRHKTESQETTIQTDTVPLDEMDAVKPAYLTQAIRYNSEDTALLDADNDAVMMEWERPLMSLHASIITNNQANLRVLNVGFGMGIIDTELQSKYKPSQHVIIEAHPTVYQRMLTDGWGRKAGVELFFGKWQDVVPILINEKRYKFDGVFFDTFGEHWIDMENFHAHLPNLLYSPSGVYSFFNGLAPDNVFFHGVCCQVLLLQLGKLGLDTEFAPCEITVNEKDWEGVRRKYWHGNTYYLPICKWKNIATT